MISLPHIFPQETDFIILPGDDKDIKQTKPFLIELLRAIIKKLFTCVQQTFDKAF